MRNAYKILVGKSKGKRPLGKPRHRCKDNIKIKLKESGVRKWTGFKWLRMGSNAGSCINDNDLSGSIKVENSWATISFSEMIQRVLLIKSFLSRENILEPLLY
jgi:hypothetical protein